MVKQIFVEDRLYKREVVQLKETQTTFKFGSIFNKIKTRNEFEIALAATPLGENTDGISIPIHAAKEILAERLASRNQRNLNGQIADSAFASLLENTLMIDSAIDALGIPTSVKTYTDFLKTLEPKISFPKRILSSFDKDDEGKLRKNKDAYNIAWEECVEDPKERIRLCEKFVLYPFSLGSRMPTAFTRTIESKVPESLPHAALLSKECNSICSIYKLPKILPLSIGSTALSSRTLINDLISEIMDKNAFGNQFDFVSLSLPNNDIHNNSGQRRNFMLLYDMINQLKYEYGVKAIINDVEIALAETCMGMGFSYATTPLDGNTSTTHFRKYDTENSRYGRAPIPAELDWMQFDIFLEEYNANGHKYPFYSPTAKSLNGHKDFRAEITPEEWTHARKTIFAEATEDLNLMNNKAAASKEFVEGLRKRIWDSNKTNYTKLLTDIN
jgi:hypothetical protein